MAKIYRSVSLFATIGVLCTLMIVVANAQKLPNVQQGGLRAPANIKVDGKATEWKTGFQAYNHATEIFYTLSNDDEYLYLSLQIANPDVINKIMGGGIVFGIQKSGKKTDKGAVSITYPVISGRDHTFFRLGKKNDLVPGLHAADSAMLEHNTQLGKIAKWIGVSGVPGVDSLTSVYNEEGIKAVGLFDNKEVYTCEMAIALKHLGLSAKNADKFTYHISMNAGSGKFDKIVIIGSMHSDAAAPSVESKLQFESALQNMNATTDFWGEYTLVK